MGLIFNNANVAAKQALIAPWIAPTLLNSWVNFGGGYSTVGYYKDDMGIVHLRGFIKSGTATASTPLFVFPAGYRPSLVMVFPTMASNGSSVVSFGLELSGTGTLSIGGGFAGANSWLMLDHIQFRAEQ